jgi:hypothetical protein
MALANVNTAWKQDLYPLVKKMFEYEYQNRLNKFYTIMSKEVIDSVDYRDSGSAGYGELPDYEGTLASMNQKRGFITIYTPAEKAGAVDIAFKYAKIDKSGEAKKAGKKLAGSANMTVYMAMLRLFGRAFDANYAGGDGQPWASTSHPNASMGDLNGKSIIDPDSGTYSNLITKKLSVAAITEAQTMANRYTTPDGLPLMCDFQDNGILLVSPELESKAIEICGKDGKMSPEKLPESAENGANPVWGLKYMVIGGGADGFSATQWAIADRAMLQESAKVVFITEPTVMENDLDNPLIARYVPYVDFSTGFSDPRAIIFSTGGTN